MTFTYTYDTSVNRDLVRYHLNDIDSETAMFSDEQITMALSVEGGVSGAVIALIKQHQMKLAQEPDLKADWLSVDWKRSAAYWEKLLAEKRREFGISSRSGSAVHVYRADSLQTEAPDYEAMNDGLDELEG